MIGELISPVLGRVGPAFPDCPQVELDRLLLALELVRHAFVDHILVDSQQVG